MKAALDLLDRVPEPALVLLFGVAMSGFVLIVGLLLMVLQWVFF